MDEAYACETGRNGAVRTLAKALRAGVRSARLRDKEVEHMRPDLRPSNRRPSPATVIAVVALVFAMGGYAIGAPQKTLDNKQVTITNASGGPIDTTSPGDQVNIPLTNPTFVQKAGETVLVMARATLTPIPANAFGCGVELVVGANDPDGADIGAFMEDHTNKGDFGEHTDSDVIPARSTDRTITLTAFAVESGEEFSGDPGAGPCDGPIGDESDPGGNDTWRASVEISVVRLRN
jgi:hypothetical protein